MSIYSTVNIDPMNGVQLLYKFMGFDDFDQFVGCIVYTPRIIPMARSLSMS